MLPGYGQSAGTARRRDAIVALICAIVGAAAAVQLFLAGGQAYFYQSYMPDVLYSACGFGLVHPAELPKAASDFLFVKSASLSCADLGVPAAVQPKTLFTQVHLYLAASVSFLWRITSIRYGNLWPLVAALAGAYAAAGFVLFRLFFGRFAALIGGLILAISPVTLSMPILLRDFAKGPFILWGIALLLLARRASSLRSLFVRASLAGAAIGVGYGFRSDPILLLPIGVVFLAVGLEFGTWLTRATAIGVFVTSAVLVASPILFQPKQQPSFGTVFMQGLSEPFRLQLGLGSAPYTLGQRYSDELVLSSVAADLRPTDPSWDAHERNPSRAISQAITRSTSYVASWIDLFSADIANQALKSAAWIVGFPALVAPGRARLDPGGWIRSESRIGKPVTILYDMLAYSWVPALCAVGLIVFLWQLTAISPREALALFLMLAALLSYLVVQFAMRHVFYFEFLWVVSLFALLRLLVDRQGLGRVARSFGAVLAAVICGVIVVRFGLIAYQDHALHQAFEALLGHSREPVNTSISQTDATQVFTVPMPAEHLALADGSPDSMVHFTGIGVHWDVRAAADRLLLTLGGPDCTAGVFDVSFGYVKRDGVWQPFDNKLAVETPADRTKRTLVLVPAFYRAAQYFSKIEIPREYSGCLARVQRIVGPTRLPVILTAVLTPGWQDEPLYRAFGGFPVIH